MYQRWELLTSFKTVIILNSNSQEQICSRLDSLNTTLNIKSEEDKLFHYGSTSLKGVKREFSKTWLLHNRNKGSLFKGALRHQIFIPHQQNRFLWDPKQKISGKSEKGQIHYISKLNENRTHHV